MKTFLIIAIGIFSNLTATAAEMRKARTTPPTGLTRSELKCVTHFIEVDRGLASYNNKLTAAKDRRELRKRQIAALTKWYDEQKGLDPAFDNEYLRDLDSYRSDADLQELSLAAIYSEGQAYVNERLKESADCSDVLPKVNDVNARWLLKEVNALKKDITLEDILKFQESARKALELSRKFEEDRQARLEREAQDIPSAGQ